jgi:hypothetical protein
MVVLVGCGGAMEANKSTSPASAPSGASEFPASVGAAREEVNKDERDIEIASSDCQAACKALASLERAADRLCMVAEPQECSDARVRVDRAKRAINEKCGGC